MSRFDFRHALWVAPVVLIAAVIATVALLQNYFFR